MTTNDNPKSIFSIFAASQETFEEAKKKSTNERSKRATYFRLTKDGTYNVRILPLAPVQDAEGNFLPMERKGYEYPLRSLTLKLENHHKIINGKPAITYVTVSNAKYAFPTLEQDLVDAYVATACEKYADDDQLCKKLREGSFSGGLKWDARRCMYVIDNDHPNDGIQILQLSYSQYKDLEERKLSLWGKLNKNGKNLPCPISSIDAAYPVEIIRKTENGKASYSFNIDTVADQQVLSEDTLQHLLDMPRLPETIYRYTRYHLEATIEYLTQLDEKFDIDVMPSEAVQDCIAKIKLLLPADDTSHFSLNKNSGEKEANTEDIESLWKRFDALEQAGASDQEDEAQDLRASIMTFIENNDLDIKVTRKKSNYDILIEIDKLMYDGVKEDDDKEDDEPTVLAKPAPAIEEEDEEDDEEPAAPSVEEEDEEEPAPAPVTRRRERNDDTNEPAVRVNRREGRPPRRRS